jgi:hypothetical protein
MASGVLQEQPALTGGAITNRFNPPSRRSSKKEEAIPLQAAEFNRLRPGSRWTVSGDIMTLFPPRFSISAQSPLDK